MGRVFPTEQDKIIDGLNDVIASHAREAALLRAENEKLRAFVEVVRKRVPVARMRPDYSGLECVGCGAGPGVSCSADCWADAVNVAADACALDSSRDPQETP
jgi:uncharacterized coiled-coil protein SlyX